MKEIYFIRHGETKYNRQGIIQGGGIDSSLNALGRKQGKAFYECYKDVDFEVVLTSKLKRTHETVGSFIDAGLPWEQFAELDEMNWGVHEGKAYAPWMRKGYLNMINEWNNGNLDARLEGGESARELLDRLARFLEHLKQRPESRILVCSHGRSLRGVMTLLKGEAAVHMEKYKHQNTSLSKVTYQDDVFNVLITNDVNHLEMIDS